MTMMRCLLFTLTVAALQPPPSRIVAFGDIHGDLGALRSCLRLAGVIDAKDRWSAAPRTLVVSTGDILDRGKDDWACLRMLRRLKDEARQEDGDVKLVLGNHEYLNLAGDLRFAHKRSAAAIARDCNTTRRRAFAPGTGQGARMLADLCGSQPVVLVAGDTLFCHGGLRLPALDTGKGDPQTKLHHLNARAADWLAGRTDSIPAVLQESSLSPVWSRAYSSPPDLEPHPRYCAALRDVLTTFHCSRMVVGHTPQLIQGVNAACGGTVYRIDTGASAFYGGPKEALDLRPGQQPRILSTKLRFDFV